MKKSVVASSRCRMLLVGLAIAAASALAGGAGCILGPKQDDPDQSPTVADSGLGGGGADTSPTGSPDALGTDGGGAFDTYDPGSGLDGCKGADADGGDAMAHDGDVGCDAPSDGATDADASDVTSDAADGEGGSDVATGD